MRLRTLLVVVFATSALSLSLGGVIAVSHYLYDRARKQSEARVVDLAEQLRLFIDANVTERLNDMSVLAAIARTTATAPKERRAWVDAVRHIYPAYAWIGFADRDGRVVASTGGLLEGESVAPRPWFLGGRDAPVVVDVHAAVLLAQKLPPLPYDEPKRFIDVAAPVRDAAGTTVGVVGGHLSIAWIREMSRAAIALALSRDPSVEALILAGDGTVILGPGERDGTRITADMPMLTGFASGAERASGRGPWPDGREYFTGASRARASSGRPTLPWTIFVRQPTKVALASSRAIIWKLVGGGALFATLFALLGWWAAERLAGPLRKLASAAHRIAAAPDRAPLPTPHGYTEISELSEALTGLLKRLGERDCALAQTNADLERRVSARTAELVEARDRAEAGERARGDFLATMSHEIRTPLNAIIGFADLLAEDANLTPSQRRHLNQMRVGHGLLASVANDILDFARVEAGGLTLEAALFSPHAFVVETAALMRGAADRKGIVLTVESDDACDHVVLGDVTRLRQVLLNLANNALKFTPTGSIAVVLEQTETPAGVALRVAVCDTGIGISAEAQARLFNRFVQADDTTPRRFGGSGLGLAIAKGFIEAMGGAIGLESQQGVGSTFWFSLTLPRAPAAAAAPPIPQSQVKIGRRDGHRARLLLVEDVELNRELARVVLEAMGYHVDVAGDGQAALAMVQTCAYDLVLMDVEMPVMDGISAIRAIRALPEPVRHVPICAMTAHILPEAIAELRDAGANDHIGKPFDRAHLRAVIERSMASPSEVAA